MRQPHRMVNHTQTIRQQQPTNCLGVFDHFVGLALTGLNDVPDQSNDPTLEEHFEQ